MSCLTHVVRSALLLYALIQVSCTHPAPNQGDETTAIDLSGIYFDTLPCADCSGIATMVWLKQDSSFLYETLYLDTDYQGSTIQGRYTFSPSKQKVVLIPNDSLEEMIQLKPKRGQLMMLDREGKLIEGSLAASYHLHKDTSQLVQQTWLLSSLEGLALPQDLKSKPYIFFQKMGAKASGHGGCNAFFGAYQLSSGQQLRLGPLASTKMYCDIMAVESKLHEKLVQCRFYSVSNNELTLLNDQKEKLALFVTAPSR